MAALVGAFLKEVRMMHMDGPNEVLPDGFEVCDGRTLNLSQQDINPGGNYTLPNLLHRFILGADPTKSAGQAAVAVGNANINLPAGAPGPKGQSGENQHTNTVAEMPSHAHTDTGHTHTTGNNAQGGGTNQGSTGAGTTTGTGFANIQATGGGGPHENRPLYYGLVLIMKVRN